MFHVFTWMENNQGADLFFFCVFPENEAREVVTSNLRQQTAILLLTLSCQLSYQ